MKMDKRLMNPVIRAAGQGNLLAVVQKYSRAGQMPNMLQRYDIGPVAAVKILSQQLLQIGHPHPQGFLPAGQMQQNRVGKGLRIKISVVGIRTGLPLMGSKTTLGAC